MSKFANGFSLVAVIVALVLLALKPLGVGIAWAVVIGLFMVPGVIIGASVVVVATAVAVVSVVELVATTLSK